MHIEGTSSDAIVNWKDEQLLLAQVQLSGWVMTSDKTETMKCVGKQEIRHSKHNGSDYPESEAMWLKSVPLSRLPANSSFLGLGCRAVGISPAESSSCLNWVWGLCHTNYVSDSHRFHCFQSRPVQPFRIIPPVTLVYWFMKGYQGLPLVVQHSVLSFKRFSCATGNTVPDVYAIQKMRHLVLPILKARLCEEFLWYSQ